ncbi:hypothetical protein [Candidatus Neoehrlichia procyonis]|uniref:Uncharacterized protein n=1 Tax=Candidatus Neoehrlichia procyonis str. RAC413 TaxID=1359163 RepID=A0A0F3NNU4_9RICK|nr:hypothetical protein [Candidatus Neoehrlichia lotoris]KJV69441.1 hypothetical protein NLO413_0833 [Candidatus Neoehrlichia lotoris str. RAC413]
MSLFHYDIKSNKRLSSPFLQGQYLIESYEEGMNNPLSYLVDVQVKNAKRIEQEHC